MIFRLLPLRMNISGNGPAPASSGASMTNCGSTPVWWRRDNLCPPQALWTAKLLQKEGGLWKRLKLLWADSAYGGALIDWVRKSFRFRLEIVRPKEGQKGFAVQPRRWVVERTFGWLGRYRRLARHYERKTDSAESMIYLAMIKLMLKRIA